MMWLKKFLMNKNFQIAGYFRSVPKTDDTSSIFFTFIEADGDKDFLKCQ